MSYDGKITTYLQTGSSDPSGAPNVPSGSLVFYKNTTSGNVFAYNWTGSLWQEVGSTGFSPFDDPVALPLVAPAASAFTLVQGSNVGGAGSLSNLNSRGITLKQPARTSNNSGTVLAEQAAASSSSFTVKALLDISPYVYLAGGASFTNCGVYIQDSAGKILSFTFGQYNNGNSVELGVDGYSSIDNYSSTPSTSQIIGAHNRPWWMELVLSSGTLTWSVSSDGENWMTLYSASATAFLGSTLSYVGIFNKLITTYSDIGAGTNWQQFVNCYSWTNTTP